MTEIPDSLPGVLPGALPGTPPGPMPFRLLLDEALRQTRRHFRAIYLPVAIPVTVVATAVAAIQVSWFSRILEELGSRRSFVNPGYWILTLVYSVLLMVAYNTLQVGAVRAVSGLPVDMRLAWRLTLRGRVLATLALWYALVLASVFCCCLPVLFVGPLLAFVPAVMVDERRFGFQAVSRSVDLTRHYTPGKWLEGPLVKVFLMLFVGMLLAYLVGILVSLPFQLPIYIDMFRKAAAGVDPTPRMTSWMWLQVPSQLLNSLVSTAVYLYVSFGIALLFYDTRGRKEGTDLRAEIDSMFPAPPPPPGELPL